MRFDNNLSRNQLSKKLGYSQSEIRNWENNSKKPNYYAIEDVTTFFKIPLDVLIGEK